ncbi:MULTISPECIES: alpha/beta fold hydrolase [Cohnella]|uniref:intracellular short-chain-length polyhydroxyalkanoate depolymerase n=1 Tax=Cohnella TaxID=329857 RepID=UPI0009BB98A5|nr:MULTISPECIES: alpha/beta hydrolase [Cohnella]MBN2984565.1 alpha/beta hydrolase [Cohnella algarum]
MQIVLKELALPNGETMAYREREGGETPLLLLHGNMASSLNWDVLMERLDAAYKIYAVDLRGYGGSSYHKPIESIEDFAEDVKLFVDRLDIRTFHLMGWSNGGGVAMQFAARYPDRVRKLILLASMSTRGYPALKSDKSRKRLKTRKEIASDKGMQLLVKAARKRNKPFFKTALSQLLYRDKQPEESRFDRYVEEIFNQRNMIDVAYAANRFNIGDEGNGVAEGTGEIRNIECPILVLWGKNDLMTTEQMTREIVDDLKKYGKRAEVRHLNAGHSPLIENMDELLDSVQPFLKNDEP